jgi:hypothetical protein
MLSRAQRLQSPCHIYSSVTLPSSQTHTQLLTSKPDRQRWQGPEQRPGAGQAAPVMRARGPAAAQRAAEAALALLARAGQRAVARLAHTLRAAHACLDRRPVNQAWRAGASARLQASSARAPHCAAPSCCAAGWTRGAPHRLPPGSSSGPGLQSFLRRALALDTHVRTRTVHPVRDGSSALADTSKPSCSCIATQLDTMQPRSNKVARHPAPHARAAPPGTNVAACALSSGQRPDTPSPPSPRPAASV